MSTRRKQPRRIQSAVVSTNIKVEAKHRHHANLALPVAGAHMWCAVSMFRITDPTAAQLNLDLENLVTIEGPGCFICEHPYSAELAAQPCLGDRTEPPSNR